MAEKARPISPKITGATDEQISKFIADVLSDAGGELTRPANFIFMVIGAHDCTTDDKKGYHEQEVHIGGAPCGIAQGLYGAMREDEDIANAVLVATKRYTLKQIMSGILRPGNDGADPERDAGDLPE